jgi:cysteine desulfurase
VVPFAEASGSLNMSESKPNRALSDQLMRLPIYLDNHATTAVDTRVAGLVYRVMTEQFGNPNSVDHCYGTAAALLIDQASAEVARLVEAEPGDVRFTSGSTEAIRFALAYAADRSPNSVLRLAVGRNEHAAVLDAAAAAAAQGWATIGWMNVDEVGRVPLASLQGALNQGVDLVCLMAANNEVGTLQDVATAARLAHSVNARLLVDATQAAGRVDLRARSWDLDYLILNAHKIYGPKGVGALVGPDLATADPPRRYAGHQTTPNTPALAGFGEACRLRRCEMANDEPKIAALRDRLQAQLLAAIPGLAINGDLDHRLSNNLHVSAPGAPSDLVVLHLRETVAISTGAACASGADAPSHVLRAMGLPAWRQDGALRISLGRSTTEDEIERAGDAIIAAIRAVQAINIES